MHKAYIRVESRVPRADFRRINNDYENRGGRYTHLDKWRGHHGVVLDPAVYVIHHKDGDKRNNEVCDRPAPCPVWNCGNLAAMTRADHIREHKPGKMSGQKGFVDTYKRTRRKKDELR